MTKAKKRQARPRRVDDNPPLTAAQLRKFRPAQAVVPDLVEDYVRRRGRPPVEQPKVPLSLRIDPDVLDTFKSTGEGWQRRMHDALAKAAKRIKAA
jgi:uncharacterized protein (DUF4415 family)